jgi:hypothetical protein
VLDVLAVHEPRAGDNQSSAVRNHGATPSGLHKKFIQHDRSGDGDLERADDSIRGHGDGKQARLLSI